MPSGSTTTGGNSTLLPAVAGTALSRNPRSSSVWHSSTREASAMRRISPLAEPENSPADCGTSVR
jgi:hypothetical protein